MRLKHLELSEFKQHRKFSRDLDAGTVGITGLNHSGKTGLLRAIRWLITGKLDGKQENHVYGYSQLGPVTAHGSLRLEKGGHEGVITRSCGASSKRTLVWDGVEYLKAADVDEKMQEIFGADLGTLDKVMFIKQGELASALFGTPADREKLFVTILDVGYLQKTADALDEKIRMFEETLGTGNADLLASLKETMVELEKDLQELASRRRSLRSAGEDLRVLREFRDFAARLESVDRDVAAAQGRLAQLNEKTSETTDLGIAKAREGVLAGQLERVKTQIKDHDQIKVVRQERERLTRELEDTRSQILDTDTPVAGYDEASAAMKAMQDISDYLVERGGAWRVLKDIETIKDQKILLSRSLERIPELDNEVHRVEAALLSLDQEIATMAKNMNTLFYMLEFIQRKQDGDCKCPMCGTASTSYDKAEHDRVSDELATMDKTHATQVSRRELLTKALDKLKYTLGNAKEVSITAESTAANLSKELEKVFKDQDPETTLGAWQRAFDVLSACKQKHEAQAKRRELLTLQLGSLEKSLANLPQDAKELTGDYEQLKKDEVELQRALDYHRSEYEKVVQLLAQKTEAEMNLKRARDLRFKVSSEGTVFCDVLDNQFVTSRIAAPQLLDDDIRKLEEDERQIQELDGAINAYARQLEDIAKKITETANKVGADELKTDFINRLKAARDVFKKGALPTAYIEQKFAELCEASKEFLGRTDATFEIERDPDQTVGFIFREMDSENSVWQPQESLSGGQKVRLSIAFLIAVQQVLIPDLGLLILDEPSQHVDAPGVESLQELLAGIGKLLSDAGSQIIVCDHNETLVPAYNIHIQL